LADGIVAFVDALRDEDMQASIERLVRERVDAIAVAPLAGRLLRMVTEDGRHDDALDAGLRALDRYLDQHRDDLRRRLGDQSPWWLPGAVEDRIVDRLLDGARNVLREMTVDHGHHLRRDFEARLAKLAVDLETSPALRARGEELKHEVLSQPDVREWAATLWSQIKDTLRVEATDADSDLRSRLAAAVAAGGRRLGDDPQLRARAERSVESLVRYVAQHFDGEISALVSGTIARWDAYETASRLELLLGPDLQYIRINGTVVGGAAGLALYTIAQALR
jgi:uncharacterized membrane-anchored protein YjiN (DUF445 family)